MRRPSHRPERVAALLREAIAEYLANRAKDPRLRDAIVTHVEVTRDLAVATVRISAIGGHDARRRAVDGMEHARGHLRTQIARELQLKQVPTLRFEADHGLEHAQRIEELLGELRRDAEGEEA
jgi:ribosome-binding factor A